MGMESTPFDLWRFLAGIAVFLLGMAQLEQGLRELAGARVKAFLRQSTRTPIQGIVAGTATTALLQSSSVVGLLTLAFVGAGVLTLNNAIGVILGANLGTTVTGWLVATIGFKLDLEGAALPLIGIGGLVVLFVTAWPRLQQIGRLTLGLGMLLLGLIWMKSSIEGLAASLDISRYVDMGPFMMLLVGFGFAAIIRSSSATMMIALAALAAGQLDLHAAAAMVIGADLGTTITVLMGALDGSAAKRQVAMAHFLFNLITDVIAFLALPLLIWFIQHIIGVTDPLYGLVLFHSSFNLLGILLFLPFVGRFADFLQHRFQAEELRRSRFINQVPVAVPDAAVEALELEVANLIGRVVELNLSAMALGVDRPSPWPGAGPSPAPTPVGYSKGYEAVKQLEGEILDYCMELQELPLEPEVSDRLTHLMMATRHSVQSAKSIKDISHNLRAYADEGPEPAALHYTRLREEAASFYRQLAEVWRNDRPAARFERLAAMIGENNDRYERGIQAVYARETRERLADAQVSTLLNVVRETYSSSKYLLTAFKDLLLDPSEAEDLAGLPGGA